ncbi:MAG TPA: serpin family protein [Gemmatimonadaceae bacterium]
MSNHRTLGRTLLLAAALPLAGCADMGPAQPAGPGAALVALPRSLSAAEQSVLSSSNAFSFALWVRINATQPDSNVFVSPLSASFSLGMAFNGAANQTFDEMRSGLQFGTTPLADVDAGYKSLVALLTSLDPSVTMEIANSIWYRNSFPFDQTFLDAGANFFSATITPLNFNDAPGSLAAINSWVNDRTHGKIPTILESINASDVMYLINAIYFKGSWRTRFDATQTIAAPFHSPGGDQPAHLMHRHGTMSYAATPAYQAVDLPYGDSAFTMTVVLPDPSTTVAAVASSLDAAAWQALTAQLHGGDVDLYLPKVTMSWKRELIPDLEALGMHVPFSSTGADFTKMSPVSGLYISFVKQKTFVDINEEGTEAAAVTATGVSVTSVSVPSQMRVDRPFIFAIRERLSGTVLFMGKVVSLP